MDGWFKAKWVAMEELFTKATNQFKTTNKEVARLQAKIECIITKGTFATTRDEDPQSREERFQIETMLLEQEQEDCRDSLQKALQTLCRAVRELYVECFKLDPAAANELLRIEQRALDMARKNGMPWDSPTCMSEAFSPDSKRTAFEVLQRPALVDTKDNHKTMTAALEEVKMENANMKAELEKIKMDKADLKADTKAEIDKIKNDIAQIGKAMVERPKIEMANVEKVKNERAKVELANFDRDFRACLEKIEEAFQAEKEAYREKIKADNARMELPKASTGKVSAKAKVEEMAKANKIKLDKLKTQIKASRVNAPQVYVSQAKTPQISTPPQVKATKIETLKTVEVKDVDKVKGPEKNKHSPLSEAESDIRNSWVDLAADDEL